MPRAGHGRETQKSRGLGTAVTRPSGGRDVPRPGPWGAAPWFGYTELPKILNFDALNGADEEPHLHRVPLLRDYYLDYAVQQHNVLLRLQIHLIIAKDFC